MKTKEFIEKVRDLGYSIQLENRTQYKWADISVDDDELMERDKPVARISTGWEAWGDLYHMQFSGHNEIELLNVITEYLVTPLEEREEEKKYWYRLRGVKEGSGYLNYSTDYLTYHFTNLLEISGVTTKFTDSEVKNFPDDIKNILMLCEKIEVTES